MACFGIGAPIEWFEGGVNRSMIGGQGLLMKKKTNCIFLNVLGFSQCFLESKQLLYQRLLDPELLTPKP